MDYKSKVGELWLKRFKEASPSEQNRLQNMHVMAYPESSEYRASLPKPKDIYSQKNPSETLMDKQKSLENYELIKEYRDMVRKKQSKLKKDFRERGV